MVFRRLLLLVAALLLLAMLASAIAPGPERVAPPDATPPGTRVPETVDAEITATGTDQSILARDGDLIRFEVSGVVTDTVEIERMGRIDPISPSNPARFELIADAAGVYPIRLVDAGRRIGRLDIRP